MAAVADLRSSYVCCAVVRNALVAGVARCERSDGRTLTVCATQEPGRER